MYATIQSWMLHPRVTMPSWSKTIAAVDSPMYSGISNRFAGETE